MNKVEMLNYIDELIYKDFNKACRLFNNICKNFSYKDYIVCIDYLSNKLKEQKLLLELDSDKKDIYDNCIKLGRYAYDNGNYELAVDYYMMGKYVTNHPVFDYYIGKMLFKSNCLEEAYDYFLRYESVGGDKLLKTLLYLRAIDNHFDRKKLAIGRLNKSNKLVSIFSKNKDWRIKKRTNRYYGYLDNVKYDAYKNVIMTEEDFYQKNIDISMYDSYSFSDKLEVIRWLYRNNYVMKADKLLDKLESSSISLVEKREINHERRLKVLYRNQAKYR